jgi:hypothetical protein
MRAHNSPLAAAFNTARPAAADYADSPNVKICRHADSAGRLFACAGASRNRAGCGKLSANNRKEAMMSDDRDPNNPLMRNTAYEPGRRPHRHRLGLDRGRRVPGDHTWHRLWRRTRAEPVRFE